MTGPAAEKEQPKTIKCWLTDLLKFRQNFVRTLNLLPW